ncbi:MAG: hypothetical protein ACUVTG_15770 [Candidatus Oleimicrobiaceae bacterium]
MHSADDFAHLAESHKVLAGQVVSRLTQEPEHRVGVCQEVFLRLYRHLPGFRGEPKLPA